MSPQFLADARQFLDILPRLLGLGPGERPRDCLVLVGFRGVRTLAALRCPLPVSAAAVDPLIGRFCGFDGCDGLLPVVYLDGPLPAGVESESLPHRGVLEELCRTAEHAGLPLRDALCVGTDRAATYFGAPGADPALDARPGARAVPPAGARAPDGAGAARDPEPGEGGASELFTLRLWGYLGRLRALELERWRWPDIERPREAWEALGEPGPAPALPELAQRLLRGGVPPEPALSALLLMLLSRSASRDVMIQSWAWSAELGWRIGREYTEHPPERWSGAQRLAGVVGPGPDPRRLRQIRRLCRALGARLPPVLARDLDEVEGWAAWAEGDTEGLRAALERSPRGAPAGELRQLLEAFRDSGHAAHWPPTRSAESE